jgi:hypothetical protein
MWSDSTSRNKRTKVSVQLSLGEMPLGYAQRQQAAGTSSLEKQQQ